MLNSCNLSFQAVTQAYHTILDGKADKALSFTSYTVVLVRAGELHLALNNGGAINIGNSLQLTEEHWDCERGCWSAHASSEFTTSSASFPLLLDITGSTITSFNVDALRFTFEGDDIQDPTLSECGRFTMSPSYYGFNQIDGGAWELAIGEGDLLQLAGDAFIRMNQAGEITGRVLLSEVKFDFESDPDAKPASYLPEALARAARTSTGMIEYTVPSLMATAIAEGYKLGLFEVIGNGLAHITEKGKLKVQGGAVTGDSA
ncbi:hypothetical protein H8F21_13905 [Pseudomonas sp. P66]|uniref:Uncharacterized protein n=1 Tax=Pseudomonas arcuscaelestis TaxID=2710591 RepID=A0ABS2BYZ1_9PSED|nr:hypothetical protein [Pseudomonas arcuscaelestis]MBM5458660.1 hypothetical protein [Pseudomonas arcuscaelestis]